MTQLSNADKQARYRKKEELKRRANNIFKEWQLKPWQWNSMSPQDVQHSLDNAINLPSGWTEEDYEQAVRALEQLQTDLWFAAKHLKNDVDAGWNSQAFMTTADPAKFISENKEAVKNTQALASHLISALRLSKCNEVDQAAALMEALRFIGRSLAASRDIPRSQATAICLACIGPHYNRPDWFTEELAHVHNSHIDQNLVHQLVQHLSKSSRFDTKEVE